MGSSPSSPHPDSLPRPGPSESSTEVTPVITVRQSYPAITHFAVLGTFILPFTLLPYLLCKRQLSVLRRNINSLETSNVILRQDLNAAMLETGQAKEEVMRIRGLLHEMMEEIEELRTEGQQREASRKAQEDSTRSELQKLLAEARHTRLHGESLRALGVSLADIAAFMHEMELRMPLLGKRGDKSRVEQLRLSAYQMQNLPSSPDPTTPALESKSSQQKKP
ncbi:hypothetical protein Moror_17617 [Moniliophthora roreri MCA 2997]|uniref:Uncharacterized protein n=2 Tax=Moniliophthora roreri TaxID=221103 RepID=V2XE20_MONRO|nr:hypothetical protein Moror_17617 [Moniliophthora roreri MCA 2997]